MSLIEPSDHQADPAISPERLPVDTDSLVLELDGFEGPIDLLLGLAREQKLDLTKISILPLAEQYLTYIATARKLRLEIAADYLVMAAWLAYLKSRLLLPPEPEPEPGEVNPADMAEALRFQLLRLEAMQQAAKRIQDLPRLDIDIFQRGMPEKIEVEEKPVYFLPIQDLLSALAAPQRRRKPMSYNIAPTRLFSLEESVNRLRRLLGMMPSWNVLQSFLPAIDGVPQPLEVRSALASTFAATLELVKNGALELRQDGTFAPIYLHPKQIETDGTHSSEESSS